VVAQVYVESFSLMEKAGPLLHVNKGIKTKVAGGRLYFSFQPKWSKQDPQMYRMPGEKEEKGEEKKRSNL
jgi:hypothetical protein